MRLKKASMSPEGKARCVESAEMPIDSRRLCTHRHRSLSYAEFE